MSSSLVGFILQETNPNFEFEILHVLGKGGFGSVYLEIFDIAKQARSLVSGELVATKQVNIEQHEGDLESIRLEIQILSKCCHPNVVQYLGSYIFDDTLWINLEFCEGGSVADIMNDMKVPLQEEQISVICRESLKGLAYLHERKIVHRDIKGGNIMINSQGEVKLADFGVSAQLTESVNKKNTCVGTPFWMSPEVIMQTQHDGKADIWSLGITAIEMAEMVPPHNTVHPMRVLFLVPKEDPPKLTDQSQARWTPSFHSFIETCLVKDPLRRPSALELLNHPFVANSLSVADVLHPLVLQAKSVKSAKSATSEQFETVLFSKGIPERVEMLSERFSGSPPCAAAESEVENVQCASALNHKPAQDALEVDAPAGISITQSAHNEVELEYPSADCQIDSQDMHYSSIGVSCNKSDQAAGAMDSARSYSGELSSVFERYNQLLPCMDIPANLHENLLQASSLETEKFLFHKHFAHAHREDIKDISPILGNFLLAAELENQQTTDESNKQRFDAYLSVAIDRKYS